mmetsp:Transcript_136791/g.332497  ORF Transcript_136791/g.332497 Transcript_136791/m.332497 type:complete len:162 (-) Transcript_136791:25-510(-)
MDFFHRQPGLASVQFLRAVLGPDVKMIMTIRDPVDWLDSFTHVLSLAIGSGFEEAVFQLSCMADSLEAWLQIFPAEQFLFICAEDFFHNETATMQRVFDFIGVPPPLQAQPHVHLNPHGHRKPIPMDVRTQYHASQWAKDCRGRLERLTGVSCNWEGSSQG